MEKGIALYSYIKEMFGESAVDVKTYSPQTLAFIGDCVFDLVVRTCLVGQGNCPTHRLHKAKSALVKASAQAAMAEALYDFLTPEEQDIYRRGRNAKTASSAKNASLTDYHKATGLEALCGYLYLRDDTERIVELIRRGVELIGGDIHGRAK